MANGLKLSSHGFTQKFALFFALALALRVCAVVCFPLSPDEAYYWVWSKFPQMGYFDHPGMISWLQWLLAKIIPDLWVPRLAAVIWSQLQFVITWLIAWRVLRNEKSVMILALIFLANPLTGLGGIVSTPDLPLQFFYSLTLLLAVLRIQTDKHWLTFFIGVGLGLGFSSKYTALLFGLPLGLTWIFRFSGIRAKWSEIPMLVLGLLLGAAPTLFWNYKNEFVSFKFQLSHGFSSQNWSFDSISTYLLVVFTLVGPYFIFKFPYRIKAIGKMENHPKIAAVNLMLWLSVLIPLGVFFYSSTKSFVEANWIIVAFVPAWILTLVSGKVQSMSSGLKWNLAFWVVPQFYIAGLYAVGQYQLIPHKVYETNEFSQLVDQTRAYRPLYLSNYQLAAFFWYKTQTPAYKLKGSRRLDFFDFLPESQPQTRVFFFVRNEEDAWPSWLEEQTAQIQLIKKFQKERFELYRIELK